MYIKIAQARILATCRDSAMAHMSFWRKIKVEIVLCKELLVSSGRIPSEWIHLFHKGSDDQFS